jgi:branched-chain amino acid transport system substrate-binding protein
MTQGPQLTSKATVPSDPIKLGVMLDQFLPPTQRFNQMQDVMDAIALTVDEGLEEGVLDRPVEFVFRQVEGLPRGSVHPVLEAWQELADAGCVLIYGPVISENAIALRRWIESSRTPVASIGMCGTEDWLGRWSFALPNGHLAEEPYVMASVIAQEGHKRVAVAVERSLIGRQYYDYFQNACELEGIQIIGDVWVPQIETDKREAAEKLKAMQPDGIVVLGFGFAVPQFNEALGDMKWDPPRYTNTGFELGYFSDEYGKKFAGWTGLEQYDERNLTGQAFLDRFESRYGRRPEYWAPLYGHDWGRVAIAAIAGAKPLDPAGVRDALERIKMIPAACGAPETRISFGNYRHMGWHGAGYLTARQFDASGTKSDFRGVLGAPTVEGRTR